MRQLAPLLHVRYKYSAQYVVLSTTSLYVLAITREKKQGADLILNVQDRDDKTAVNQTAACIP